LIRITELALPLDHAPAALPRAIAQRLRIDEADVLSVAVFKRSYDARRRNSAILFVYIVDVTVRDEVAVLARFASDPQVQPAPDTQYHPVGQAPAARHRGAPGRRGLRTLRPVRGAGARAGRPSGRSCSNAARTSAVARRTPGRCGGSTR
jgi:uncharacterized FAD-dependent dehydrogenase